MKPTTLCVFALLAILITQPACLLSPKSSSSTDAAPATQPQNGVTATPTPTPTTTDNGNHGQAFFTSTILPLLNTNCASCHTIPAQAPAGALLDIFSYTAALTHLSNGTGDSDNDMWDGANGIGFHSSGKNLCASAPSLCANLKLWYDGEDITVNGNNPSGGLQGVFDLNFTYDGQMTGWAVDTSDLTASVTVKIYNGTMAAGTLLTTVTANGTHFNVPYNGDHGFTYQLPTSLEDAQTHNIYAYAIPSTGDPVLLTNSPLATKIFLPNTAGQNYYTATLQPALTTACQSCHSGDVFFTYSGLFALVANSTTPPFGSTASNNLIITKATGGDSHGGGTRCSTTQSPCKELISWFALEFN